MSDDAPDGFLARWSRRKERARSGVVVEPAPAPVNAAAAAAPLVEAPALPAAVVDAPAPAADPPHAPPLPTMADVALLSHESDYSRFVASEVDVGVKRAAMKKLFSDPHFNVMDGLDTYIDDYGQPDPIPLAMLRQMNQSKFLGLFETDTDDATTSPDAAAPPAPAAITETAHDDPDLRLQQDDDAGRPGAGEGAGA
jgi:hypothetical protein